MALHSGGKAEGFLPDGKSRGAVEGNSHHLKFGKHVLQIDPGGESKRTIFLHVLTATDADDSIAPKVDLRRVGEEEIEVRVNGATTRLSVPR